MEYNQLLKDYSRAIQKMAYSFRINDSDVVEDLIQIGRIALWDASIRYDKDNAGGVRFEGYFKVYCRGKMMTYLSENLRTIRIPNNALRLLKKGENYLPKGEFIQESSTLSLNTPIGSDNSTLSDVIAIEVEEDTPDFNPLHIALNSLSIKDEDIMKMYWGISPYEDKHTLKQIGDKYGKCRENIRQIIKKVLKKLKTNENVRRILQGN